MEFRFNHYIGGQDMETLNDILTITGIIAIPIIGLGLLFALNYAYFTI
jgi:hypothetical protein